MKNTLLIEIGTEELPAKELYNLSVSFHKNIINTLHIYNIKYNKIINFATARRLAIKIENINNTYKTKEIKRKGPSIIYAFNKNNLPSLLTLNWCKSCNIKINEAKIIKTSKGEWLYHIIGSKTLNVDIILPIIIKTAIKNISISKYMRWNTNNFKFSRPIRSITILLGDKIIPIKIFGIPANRVLRNHISHPSSQISIKHADEYPDILFKESKIIAKFEERKNKIIKDAQHTAKKINGILKISDFLLQEITSLIESPNILIGSFNKIFLQLPHEILVYIMEHNQKYFPIYNKDNKALLPNFIFVSNIQLKNSKNVILGNETVIHARFKDAEFFFNNDQKNKLEYYLPYLKNVIFQKKLGSLYEKTNRIKELMIWISSFIDININYAIRSATLCKCDLITNMVCEFPELQGIIGMHYAIKNKENKEVSIAIKEHYLPKFSGDLIPDNPLSYTLSVVDKIDTLSGIFYIGEYPKSDKDPFALRRAAIGIIRIIITKKINIDLKKILEKSVSLYKKYHYDKNLINKLMKFILERCHYWYLNQGYTTNVIQSILSCHPTKLIDIDNRIKIISYFQTLDSYKSIILLYKRICNILKKNKIIFYKKIDCSLLQEPIEKDIEKMISHLNIQIPILIFKKKYKEALYKIISLNIPMHDFFSSVMINHKDIQLRCNRLTILNNIKKIFLQIADFSFLTIIK